MTFSLGDMHIFLSIKLGVILHYNICTDLSIQVFCYGKWLFHKKYTFVNVTFVTSYSSWACFDTKNICLYKNFFSNSYQTKILFLGSHISRSTWYNLPFSRGSRNDSHHKLDGQRRIPSEWTKVLLGLQWSNTYILPVLDIYFVKSQHS